MGLSMELREALTQIAEIRTQMARGQVFRGYRSVTTMFSGVVALVAGAAQYLCVGAPADEPTRFVGVWLGAGILSLCVVGAEMILRTRRSNSIVQRQLSLLAVEQFMPSLVVGGLLGYVFAMHLPRHLHLLPGLWMLVFSLGVFASSRLLPRAIFGIGAFYLLAGILTMLVAARDPGRVLVPWVMAGVFAIGQGATAAILFVKLERHHE